MPGHFAHSQWYLPQPQRAGAARALRLTVIVKQLDGAAAACGGAFEQAAIGDCHQICGESGGGQPDQQLGADPRRLTGGDGEPGQEAGVHAAARPRSTYDAAPAADGSLESRSSGTKMWM